MTLSYDFGRDDLLAWYRHYHKSSTTGERARSRYIACWVGALLGGAILLTSIFRSWPAAALAFGLSIALCFAVPRWYDREVESQLKSMADDPQLQGSYGRHQLILTDEGVREITPVTDSLSKWPSITDVVPEGGRIFVRLASGHAAVICRQSYSGPVPFEDLPRVINQYRESRIQT